jgi:hypothetical protein
MYGKSVVCADTAVVEEGTVGEFTPTWTKGVSEVGERASLTLVCGLGVHGARLRIVPAASPVK